MEDDDISAYLLNAIRGKGAFRDETYREIARDWCEYHSIEYEE